jgi:hypothetical protein
MAIGLPVLWLAVEADRAGAAAIAEPVLIVMVLGLLLLAISRTSRWAMTGSVVALVTWLPIAALGFVLADGPYVTFEQAALRCSHQPVIAERVITEYNYYLPGSSRYHVPVGLTGPITYYCTAEEAEAAGYSRFP